MMKRILVSVAAAACFCLVLCARADAQNIKGIVYDENDNPMEFATVVLLSLPDSTIVGGGMTDVRGAFDIEKPLNAALVQVSMIGYKLSELPEVAFSAPVTIRMRRETEMLEGAVVSAQLPRTEIKGDAVVTNVAGSVLEHSGNAYDVLAKVPGMISTNGELEVLGRGTPVYYINGRKITDNSELRNLMSEDIKSVDVVSNPGALYGGDVRCVVRIRTVKRQGEGFSFALSSQLQQRIYKSKDFSPSWSVLDMNYRTGGWDFFGKVVYWDSINYQVGNAQESTFINNVSHLQDGIIDFNNHYKGMQYEAGANWQINEKHSIGFKINRDNNISGTSCTIFDTDVILDGVLDDHLYAVSNANSPYSSQWRGNLYYDGNIDKLNINFNADFVKGKSRTDTETEETSWKAPVEISAFSTSGSILGAGKLVLSYPIWKGMLQAGAEETYVVADQQYQITLAEIPSSNATLTENTIAGFAQYSLSLPFGQIGAGLRYEHVDMQYTDYIVASSSLERHQNNWFPSVNFSASAGPVYLSLSYTGKTVRPNYSLLSNEIMYDNHFIYQSGDPTLMNEKHQTLSFMSNWNWLTFSSNYEHVEHKFVQWATPFNDEGVVMLKFANLSEPVSFLNFFLNASPSIGVWYPRYTVGLKQQFLKMTVEDPRAVGGKRDLSLDKPMMYVQAGNTFRFKNRWEIEANYQFISSTHQDIYFVEKPLHTLGFSIQKSFLKNDALNVRLSWVDVLNGNVVFVKVDYGRYVIRQDTDRRNPCVQLRIAYRFNSANSKYKGTGAGQDARSRL